MPRGFGESESRGESESGAWSGAGPAVARGSGGDVEPVAQGQGDAASPKTGTGGTVIHEL